MKVERKYLIARQCGFIEGQKFRGVIMIFILALWHLAAKIFGVDVKKF